MGFVSNLKSKIQSKKVIITPHHNQETQQTQLGLRRHSRSQHVDFTDDTTTTRTTSSMPISSTRPPQSSSRTSSSIKANFLSIRVSKGNHQNHHIHHHRRRKLKQFVTRKNREQSSSSSSSSQQESRQNCSQCEVEYEHQCQKTHTLTPSSISLPSPPRLSRMSRLSKTSKVSKPYSVSITSTTLTPTRMKHHDRSMSSFDDTKRTNRNGHNTNSIRNNYPIHTSPSSNISISTPKAKSHSRFTSNKSDDKLRNENIVTTNGNSCTTNATIFNQIQTSYELPQSIHFLSLVLPFDYYYNNNKHDDTHHTSSQEQKIITPPPVPTSSPLCHCLDSSAVTKLSSTNTHAHTNIGHRKKTPSIASTSDTTTTTASIATDIMSATSGQTTLAKDRVQETIICSIEAYRYLRDFNNATLSNDNDGGYRNDNNIPSPTTLNISENNIDDIQNKETIINTNDYIKNNSPTSVDCFQRCPVNVDFVLESNETEIASFVNLFIRSKQYDEVIDIYRTVLSHFQKQFGPQYPLVITTLHNLGVVYVLKRDYKRALTYCQKALKLKKKTLGDAHPSVVTSLCELGIIYYAREDFNKGLDALRQALHIYYNSDGNHDYKVSGILNNIGCIHFSMGKLIASIATFQESLDMQRQLMGSVGSDDAVFMLLNMSITLCNAGIVSAKNDRPEVATSLVEEGLMVQQSVLPDDHRLVKATAMTIAKLLGGKKGTSESCTDVQLIKFEPSARQLSNSSQLQVMNKILYQCSNMLLLGSIQNGGLNSQQRVSSAMQYKSLTCALLNEGYSKRACSWVTVASKTKGSTQIENDFNLAHVCEQAAQMIQRKELDKATKLFHKIRQSHSNKCGDVDVILASIHHIFGLIYLHTKNYQSARFEFQEAINIRSRQLDPDHMDVLESRTKYAITMIALQDFDNAIATLQTILTHTRRRFGYSHYSVAIIINNIGICHYEFGGLLAALKSFEESVEILQDAIIQDQDEEIDKVKLSILLGRSLQNLSYIHFKRKDYADAIVALEDGLKVYRKVFGSDHKIVKIIIESLAFIMATANCLDNKDKLDHMTEMYIDMLGSDQSITL